MTVTFGIEQLAAAPPSYLRGKRIGLLCNQASVDREFMHCRQRLKSIYGNQLTALFSPQHGLFAEKQDNMVESPDRHDPLLGIPVFSLYSHSREPSESMFNNIDALLIDLQDVGTRVYTFIYTMSYCMEAAHRYSKKIVVLDRPNPVGGRLIEGNCLEPAWRSFVGRYPIPMRHGLTIGELALMFNNQFGIQCDLAVIPMQGWRRGMFYHETGLNWVTPSPNLPTAFSSYVYPGQVLWEGTNVSEGRGTTQPFEVFGAPFIDSEKVLNIIGGRHIDGAVLRPVEFEPTTHKWKGECCRGFQIHVTDPQRFRPYRTSLALLQAVMQLHADQFQWKKPPYEYDYERMPIDLILGSRNIRDKLSAMEPIDKLEADWQDELEAFDTMRRKYLLYEDC
jgi:uncharacterized protein YbbC (DUF1343 family)